MKKPLMYITFILVVVATYIFFPSNKIKVENDMAKPPLEKEISPPVTEVNKQAQQSPPKETSISQNALHSFNDSVPDTDLVHEEYNSNPHTPSKSLMTFSKRLGPLMEKAFKNEKDANTLVLELSKCARDETASKAARATCVTSVERLSESYPSLTGKAEKLRASVAPEVRKILDTNDAFIIK